MVLGQFGRTHKGHFHPTFLGYIGDAEVICADYYSAQLETSQRSFTAVSEQRTTQQRNDVLVGNAFGSSSGEDKAQNIHW
jgi:hypothetical protein